MIQMAGYSCFYQPREVLHLNKAKQSTKAQGLKLSCPVKERSESDSRGEASGRLTLRVARGAVAVISPEEKISFSLKISLLLLVVCSCN